MFSFALIKVHLEKFACKIYRDTRTAAHDIGVDLSTNFGVVYQIKRLRIFTESEANQVYAELKVNFDNERLPRRGNGTLLRRLYKTHAGFARVFEDHWFGVALCYRNGIWFFSYFSRFSSFRSIRGSGINHRSAANTYNPAAINGLTNASGIAAR
jgi:hypothetical protein